MTAALPIGAPVAALEPVYRADAGFIGASIGAAVSSNSGRSPSFPCGRPCSPKWSGQGRSAGVERTLPMQ